MKTIFIPRCVPLATALLMCAAVWLPSTSMATGRPYETYHIPGEEDPKEKKPSKKEKEKSQYISSRNNNSIKIYPDAIKREMHVVAKENDGREIEFLIFDMQGTLIQNYKMNPKDHIRLNKLVRGKYRYHVLCGDNETAAGEFEIR